MTTWNDRPGKTPFRDSLFGQFAGKRSIELYVTLPGEQLECVRHGFVHECFCPEVRVRGAENDTLVWRIIQRNIAREYPHQDVKVMRGDIADLPVETTPAKVGLAYLDYKGNPNKDNAYYIKYRLPQNFDSDFAVGITFDQNLRGPLNSFIPTVQQLFRKWEGGAILSRFEKEAAQTRVRNIHLCAVFAMLTRFYFFPFWRYDYKYDLIEGESLSDPKAGGRRSPHTMCLLHIPKLATARKPLDYKNSAIISWLLLANQVDMIVNNGKRRMSITQACAITAGMAERRTKAAVVKCLHDHLYGPKPPSGREEEAERVSSILLASAILGLESEKTLAKGGQEGQGHIRQALGWTILTRQLNRKVLRAACTCNDINDFLDRFGLLVDNDQHRAYGYMKRAHRL